MLTEVLCRVCRGKPIPLEWVRAGRRLCPECHGDRQVGPSLEECERTIAEQLPTMPYETDKRNHMDRQRPHKRKPLGPPKPAKQVYPVWRRLSSWLTEDTSPEAIAAAQREAVAEAVRQLGGNATAEQISAAVILPVWSVKRRLKELKRTRRQTA